MTEPTSQHVAKLRDLFFFQSDHHAEMWRNKKDECGYSPACQVRFSTDCKKHNYHCDDCPIKTPVKLTDERLRNHLIGKITLGAYQLKGEQVKWLCLDFDAPEENCRQNARDMARMTWAAVDHLSIAAYLEDSGNKGNHLWLFFEEPVSAVIAQGLGKALLAHTQNEDVEFIGVEVEVFPKQTKLDGPDDYGNLVKVPFGVHKKSGRRCVFIDSDGQPYPDQLAALLDIQTVSALELNYLLEEFPVVRAEPAKQSKALDTRIPEGERDRTLTSLAGTMRRRGMTPDEIFLALQAVNDSRCKPPLPEDDLQRIARSVGKYEPEQAAQGELETRPHYELTEDGIQFVTYKPIRGNGQVLGYESKETPVCDFSIQIANELVSYDGDEAENLFTIGGRTRDRGFKFDVSAAELADDRKLRAHLLTHAGGKAIVWAGQMKHIVPALQALSNGYLKEVRYVSTGWQKVGERWIFVTPGGCVGVDQARCDLPAELRHYRVSPDSATLPSALKAIGYLLDAFDHAVTYPVMAHAFLPPLLRFLPTVKRYACHLTGETGSLKTTFATLLCCLYGDFGHEEPTEKWTSTVNKIEVTGHAAKDVLYVVDDYKPRYVQLKDFTQLIQNYSDGRGKGRLNRDATVKTTQFIRGLVLSTGEDLPETEASVMARLLVVNMPRHDGKNEKLALAAALSGALPAAMGQYIRYLIEREGALDAERRVNDQRDDYLKAVSGQGITNTGRLATNLAQNWFAFATFAAWLVSVGAWTPAEQETRLTEYDQIARSLLAEMAQRVREEKASTTFIEGVKALLSSGEAVILDRLVLADSPTGPKEWRINTAEPPPGKRQIGWKDDQGIYLQGSVAFHEVEKWMRQIGKSIGFTEDTLWRQLQADGHLLEPYKTMKTRDGTPRLYHFTPTFLQDEELLF
jgi:hypothetical protein